MIHHPDYVAINQAIRRPTIAHRASPFLRDTMYVLQIADSIISANGFRCQHLSETNPTMRPFSHGGASMMLVGFGVGDLVRHIIFRRASTGMKNTVDALQAATNVEGILQTFHWDHAITSQSPSNKRPMLPKGRPKRYYR